MWSLLSSCGVEVFSLSHPILPICHTPFFLYNTVYSFRRDLSSRSHSSSHRVRQMIYSRGGTPSQTTLDAAGDAHEVRAREEGVGAEAKDGATLPTVDGSIRGIGVHSKVSRTILERRRFGPRLANRAECPRM